MTLDDPEHWDRSFIKFQEQIAPKSLGIDQDNLPINFSALNVDFNDPSQTP